MPTFTASARRLGITRDTNPIMKSMSFIYSSLFGAFSVASMVLFPSVMWAAEPSLTEPGVIDALRHKNASGYYDGHVQYSSRSYDDTYNLGATGMRGWIYDFNPRKDARELGFATELSRKILVTTVGADTPASRVGMQKDDVILGVSWGNNPVHSFTSDARKTLGVTIVEAEKTENGGNLNVKFWRLGAAETVVQLKLDIMGDYKATAPSIPKSTAILDKASMRLIQEMRTNPSFFGSYGQLFTGTGAVNGLALLSAVAPTHPDYSEVQSRLKSYVASMNAPLLDVSPTEDKPIWRLAYENIFLSEYYLHTLEKIPSVPDSVALDKLEKYTVALARAQSRYGTFGHGGSVLKANGDLHGAIPPYGSVNGAGVPANLSIVLGRIALLKGGRVLNPEIDPAIGRANKFFAYYVNKGTIPYGEHRADLKAYSLNSKDQACAVMFALQNTFPSEAEYFSRISIAGYHGREEGHNGNGFNYLWEAIGANVGGPLAVAKYMEKIHWSLDLERRSDGSFTYDGQRTAANAGSTTSDGSYFGVSQYYDLNPTATHLLTYSAPLKRLYITGKNTATPALSAAKVDNAIAAGSFQVDGLDGSNEVMIAKLSEYDPMVREAAAQVLLGRATSDPLTSSQVNDLVASITNTTLSTDVTVRLGACRTLGLLRISSALPALEQRLSDENSWVRSIAAEALGKFGSAASNSVDAMLLLYTQNAQSNPEVINPEDPVQVSSGLFSNSIFKGIEVENGRNVRVGLAEFTSTSPKFLLYPALKAALKQPNSSSRQHAAKFAYDYFTYDDAKTLTADLTQCATTTPEADSMFSMYPRLWAVSTLEKYGIPEGVQAAMSLLEVPRTYDWGAQSLLSQGLSTLENYGYASTPHLPTLRAKRDSWLGTDTPQLIAFQPRLVQTIGIIEGKTPNSSNDILSFEFPGFPQPAFSGTNITLTVPLGTDVTAMAPIYTHSPTAKASFASGTTRNFSTPQLYPIIATDLNPSAKVYKVTVIVSDSIVTYNFDSGGLQGWNNRVWNGTKWIDLPPNVTTYSPILPNSATNNLFGPLGGAVGPVGGHIDDHRNTLWLRSPQFYLSTSGDITVQLSKGIANTSTAPTNENSVPFNAIYQAGWKGVALRNVSTNNFVLTKARTGTIREDYRTVTFTQAELANLDRSAAYTLELINSDYGGWGWITMDNVWIPSVSQPIVPNVELTVTNGLVLRMDASQITGTGDGAQLNTWVDTSSVANSALRQSGSSSGYPKYVANAVNGRPVVRFNSGAASAGDHFRFNRISTIRTVFWILKEDAGLADGRFLLGDSDNYDFHRGSTPNGPLWDSNYSSANIRNGTTKLMGNTVNGTTTSLPSGSFKLVSLETSGNVSANQICQDRTYHGSWQGDIAEILIYDRTLSGEEENKVGTYLSNKYGLQTSYNALPVSSGLVLRMDASKITETADGAQLNTWADSSGAANNAVRQSSSSIGYPKYVASGINGQPVVRFNSGNGNTGDFMKFNRITNMRSVFWVFKENAGLSGTRFLLGDDSSYEFHRGSSPNGPLWESNYSSTNIRHGTTKLMGSTINGTTTPLPSGSFQLVSLVTAGNVQANQICQDRTYHGSWQGDIAEILVYNRALTVQEEAAVGSYLAAKYGLATNYPPSAILPPPSGVVATPLTSGLVNVSWTPVPGAAGYNVWRRNTQTNVEQIVSTNAPSLAVTSLNNGVPHEFKVSANNTSGVRGNYSSIVTATPMASAACDITSFAVPGQLSAVISGNTVSVTVAAGTSVTALAPTYRVSPGASGNPASGSTQNFSSPLAYTITADNGTSMKTYTVTVSSAILTWNSNISGSWNDGSKWVSGTSPASTGLASYSLNFNVPGDYTAHNNLNPGFLVNRLNFGGSSVTLTGNSLAMAVNASTAPQLNQDGTASVTVSNNLSLNATTLIAGTSSGTMTLSGIVSGSGGLTKSCSGDVTLTGANTYTGGTTVTAGTLHTGLDQNTALGSGAVTLNAGTTLRLNRTAMSNSITLNSATLKATNGFGDALSGPVSLSGISTFDLENTGNLVLSGAVSGSGGLTKAGNSTTLTLSGTGNSYSGGTIVSGGTLSCTNVGALGQGAVSVATGAKLGLAFSGTRQVSTLKLGGAPQQVGTYGSTSSGATNRNDTWFSGTGMINVTSTSVASMASTQSATVNATPLLPVPWMSGSIGSGMLTGSTSYGAGTFSQSGSGALGSTSDKLNFSYQTLSGDGDITSKITLLQDTGALSRVGVMIRETLATNSKYVFMGMSGSNTYLTGNRATTGGASATALAGTGTVPNTWVRLVRTGDVVTAYKSPDGATWTPAGSTTVTMATSCYIGLAVSSGSDTILNSSQFSNLTVTP
jgi:autotransporter-associated beta strand protein